MLFSLLLFSSIFSSFLLFSIVVSFFSFCILFISSFWFIASICSFKFLFSLIKLFFWSFKLYIFNSRSFIFEFNLSFSALISSSNNFSLVPFFCSSIIFFNFSISFCFDEFISFNFAISLSFAICNFLYSSILFCNEFIEESLFESLIKDIIFEMFEGRSELIELNSVEFDFNKESKKDEIDSEFCSYNFF